MFKKVYLLITVCGVAGYLYFFGVQNLKKLIGYNVPAQTDLPQQITGNPDLSYLKLPDGFKISIFAKDLNKPRVIAFDLNGKMVVSETKKGDVILLEDKDNDNFAESKKILIANLKSPHGLAFYKDAKTNISYIYIAEEHQVTRYKYDVSKSEIDIKSAENIAFLPSGGGHFTRTIAFGPNYRTAPLVDGIPFPISNTKLYISVGSSCDVCVESTWKRASILESDPDGNYTAEFAGGLRNSVFFTFHPQTGEMWATEMGRDNLGDNLPPDEINIVKVADSSDKYGAKRYGWPFCYGNQVKDDTFKPAKVDRIDISQDCSQTVPAAIELPAHSAPLGLAFVPSIRLGWPKDWQNNLLIAYHGSWNRSEPTGYKIARFVVDRNGKVSKSEDFISGWLKEDPSTGSGQETYGRPVDLKFDSSGSLYISDDSAGIIYKVSPDSPK